MYKFEKQKIVYNRIIPFSGFLCINLFGVLFVRIEKSVKGFLFRPELTNKTLNHEAIHTAQMKELWYIPFYILYILMWIINLFRYGFSIRAYYNIPFEKEAYENQYKFNYLDSRKKFAWFKK